MKIAILHEMLIKLGGAEKVVGCLRDVFPDADLYTLIYDEQKVGSIFPRKAIHPSCLNTQSQRIYNYTKKQRLSLPFMKKSVQSLDFSMYDRVIVSSSGFAHGLKTGKNTKTIIYYHAPARYMWDWTHEYRKEISLYTGIKGYLYGNFMKRLRLSDYEFGQNGDIILANSHTTKTRIQKYYRRNAQVLFPPIETKRFAEKISSNPGDSISTKILLKGKYYIILSALTEFKKIDIAINAFKKLPDIKLIIIGDGEYRSNLEKISQGKENIVFVGAQYDKDLVWLVQNSLGLIFPGEEDFGIVPIEIMAAGKPVFALRKGGLTETIIAGKTGDFFSYSSGSDFIKHFEAFHAKNLAGKYTEYACKSRAFHYDKNIFVSHIKKLTF